QVPRPTHWTAGMRVLRVTGDGSEIERDFSGDGSSQVRQNKHSTVPNAHQVQPFFGKITANLFRHGANSLLNPGRRDQRANAFFLPLPDFSLCCSCLGHFSSPLAEARLYSTQDRKATSGVH